MDRRGSSHCVIRVLWSIKNILPSEWTLSSHPSGNGPSSSSGRSASVVLAFAALGIGLALPVLGSTHDVPLVLWSIKKTLPFGASCIDHPSGKPASGFINCAPAISGLTPSMELCRDCDDVPDKEEGWLDEFVLSEASTSSFYNYVNGII